MARNHWDALDELAELPRETTPTRFLVATLTALGRLPCDSDRHGRCRHFERCKRELLACDDFAYYVLTGNDRRTVRGPTHARYKRIYRGEPL